MEKFIKYAEIVNKVLNALFIAFLVLSIVMTCFTVIGFVFDPSLIGEADTFLTFGGLKIEIAEDAIVQESVNKSLPVISLITAVQFAMGCFFVKLLQGIITPMTEGKPFGNSVYEGLRKLSIFTLISGIANGLLDFIDSILVFNSYDIGSLFNEQVLSYSFEVVSDGDFVVFAVVLYLLSYIFKYGTELQAQVDETL